MTETGQKQPTGTRSPPSSNRPGTCTCQRRKLATYMARVQTPAPQPTYRDTLRPAKATDNTFEGRLPNMHLMPPRAQAPHRGGHILTKIQKPGQTQIHQIAG